MSNGMNVPGEYESELREAEQRKRVAQALIKQGLEAKNEGRMVGNHYVPASWSQNLSPLVSVIAGNMANSKAEGQEKIAKEKERSALAEALKSFSDTRNGVQQPVQSQGPMPDGSAMEGTNLQQMQEPNRQKAIADAMASRFPQVQAIGTKDAAAMKDTMGLKGYDPQSRVAAAMAGDDLSLLKPEGKVHVVNGKLIKEDGGELTVAGDYSDRFGALSQVGMGADGKPLMGQTDLNSGKIAYAPGGGTTVNVDTAPKIATAAGIKAAEGAVKQVQESFERAKQAQSGLEVFMNAKSQIDKVQGGTGAEWILQAKKLAQQLGAPIDDSVTATEQVTAALAQAVLDNASKLGSGSGFSNTDRDFLKEIVLAKGSLDPATIKRAVSIGLANNINALVDHDKTLVKAQKLPGMSPEILEMMKVETPQFNLAVDPDFAVDERTGRVRAITSQGKPAPAPAAPTAPSPGKSALSPAEQSELEQLRKQFGVQR